MIEYDAVLIPAAKALRAWEEYDEPAIPWDELDQGMQDHYTTGAKMVLEAAVEAWVNLSQKEKP